MFSIYLKFLTGQPRRHLLTTGWSAFVNKKKLVSGDAVLFLRYVNESRAGTKEIFTEHSFTDCFFAHFFWS